MYQVLSKAQQWGKRACVVCRSPARYEGFGPRGV